jgi:hypothetical protein
MNGFNIYIPTPCHEDWNKMSAGEKGRFCSSCSKTVMDFSESSREDIKQYFLENVDSKTCGRFRNDQLSKPVRLNIPLRIFERQLTFSQSFFIALLLTFGSILFSLHVSGQQRLIGEVAIIKSDSDSCTVSEIVDSVSVDSVDVVHVGKTAIDASEDSTALNVDSFEFVMNPDDRLNADSDFSETMVYGGFVVCTTGYVQTELAVNPDIDISLIQTEIFPNPAHGSTNLRIKSGEEIPVEVDIIDMNGKLQKQVLHKSQVSEGENNFTLDVSGLPPAEYILKIRLGDAVETKRIVII